MATLNFNITPFIIGTIFEIRYRVLNTNGSYTTVTITSTSNPVIINTAEPNGTLYEGFLRIDCGSGIFSDTIEWYTSAGLNFQVNGEDFIVNGQQININS